MKRKKIDKIYHEMFVASSKEEDTGWIGEVVYVSNQDRIAYIQWFQGECDTFTFDWLKENCYEVVEEETKETTQNYNNSFQDIDI
tara:strand:- start:1169 stop:1423 length:255 start_codon:yes stop_codon:yes gene_type:complete